MNLTLNCAEASEGAADSPLSYTPNPATLATLERTGKTSLSPEHPGHAQESLREPRGPPPDFVPIHLESRSHVTTAVMCHHLNRKQQTARGWASAETFPEGLRPLRVMGRLAWPVAGIKKLLGTPQ